MCYLKKKYLGIQLDHFEAELIFKDISETNPVPTFLKVHMEHTILKAQTYFYS